MKLLQNGSPLLEYPSWENSGNRSIGTGSKETLKAREDGPDGKQKDPKDKPEHSL